MDVRVKEQDDVAAAIARESWPPSAHDGSIAVLLTALIVALMIAASVLGIVVDGLYREGSWAREAFRGGDVVTLVLVVPVLITSMALARRGSVRATVVWIGALAYAV